MSVEPGQTSDFRALRPTRNSARGNNTRMNGNLGTAWSSRQHHLCLSSGHFVRSCWSKQCQVTGSRLPCSEWRSMPQVLKHSGQPPRCNLVRRRPKDLTWGRSRTTPSSNSPPASVMPQSFSDNARSSEAAGRASTKVATPESVIPVSSRSKSSSFGSHGINWAQTAAPASPIGFSSRVRDTTHSAALSAGTSDDIPAAVMPAAHRLMVLARLNNQECAARNDAVLTGMGLCPHSISAGGVPRDPFTSATAQSSTLGSSAFFLTRLCGASVMITSNSSRAVVPP
mmetsp:Transcript_104099/g.238364  ORF Transcript_104099/g.238364 Transcript_104099/m.238364 type:complete len:284 (-) Transcript_104099:310-1161(-)